MKPVNRVAGCRASNPHTIEFSVAFPDSYRRNRNLAASHIQPGGRALKKLTALFATFAFAAATTGFAAAQTAPVEKKTDAPMATKPAEKKMPIKTATGTVKSASVDSLVVSGKDKGKDVEWTFSLNDKTQIKKAGKDIVAKDVAAGDGVNVRYMDHDGKSVASAVNVRSKPAVAKETTKPAETKSADKK
jgi:hypothetical protein